jgi:hypothetical protein
MFHPPSDLAIVLEDDKIVDRLVAQCLLYMVVRATLANIFTLFDGTYCCSDTCGASTAEYSQSVSVNVI